MTSPAPASVTSTLACAVSSGLRVRSGGVCDRRRDDDAVGGRRPTEQRVDLRTIDRLALEEEIDQPVQLVPMRLQQIRRALLRLAEQPSGLLVDDPLRVLRVGARTNLLRAEVLGSFR